jgi:GntR family transcriptional regulator
MPEDEHTKYRRIAADLRAAISAGEIPEGQMLDGEAQIAERYAVTRNTVRRALGVLRSEGIIDTMHGTGSWVRRTVPRRYLGPDRYRPLAGRGTASSMVRTEDLNTPVPGGTTSKASVCTGGSLPPQLATWLEIQPHAHLLRRDALFSVDGRGQQLWTSWLPLDKIRGTPLADPGTDPWSSTTIAEYEALGWNFSHWRELTWPRMPDQATAHQLGITTGIPMLVVERVLYFRRAKLGPDAPAVPLEVAVVLLPGDSTVLVNEGAAA